MTVRVFTGLNRTGTFKPAVKGLKSALNFLLGVARFAVLGGLAKGACALILYGYEEMEAAMRRGRNEIRNLVRGFLRGF